MEIKILKEDWIKIVGIIILVIIVILIIPKKEKWNGVYYPNGCLVCENEYIFSPTYNTKEDCLNWATTIRAQRNNPDDLFECGKNCKWKDGLQVCKETIDK